MKKLNSLEYLKLSKSKAAWYDVCMFFASIPGWFKSLFMKLFNIIKGFLLGIKDEALDIGNTFKKGNWAVKLSFLVFGLGNLYYGQILRGILFLVFEIVFVVYMVIPSGGIHWISKVNWFMTGKTVGTVQGGLVFDENLDQYVWATGDDSVRVLLYGLLSVIFVIAFIATWRMQIKQCRINMEITEMKKKVTSTKDDLKSLLDEQFYKTLLAPSDAV